MSIKLEFDTKKFIRKLGKRANELQIVAAEALNEAAAEIQDDYKQRLRRKSKIRTKFSLGAIKMFKATPIQRSGEPRQLHKVNAKVFVPKLKKKDHYLLKLEEGRQIEQNSLTLGKVPIPLKEARTSQSDNKPVAGKNRINKGQTQKLQLGGRNIGVKGDDFIGNPRKRWGAFYGGMRSGKLRGVLKKPFYFIGNSGSAGIYAMVKNVIKRIRHLKSRVKKPKAAKYFFKSVRAMKPKHIQEKFVRLAKRKIGRR